MLKKIINNDVYYTVSWSPYYEYDKYTAMRILPELAGILSLSYLENNYIEYLLFYACWRDGCRVGLKKFMDTDYSKQQEILAAIDPEKVRYKYTIVDTTPYDMKDIMFWLIKEYRPLFNDPGSFTDSKRYRNIYLKEMQMDREDVIERFPGISR